MQLKFIPIPVWIVIKQVGKLKVRPFFVKPIYDYIGSHTAITVTFVCHIEPS